jgi:hypothetical protein
MGLLADTTRIVLVLRLGSLIGFVRQRSGLILQRTGVLTRVQVSALAVLLLLAARLRHLG